ncbi:MAG: flagellar biosynthesis protein FlhA [Candidatus Eremiobacteraeota bacterium]|nr:flagellar biosynthesis protein FlhA [Candidatus Eremiobacteraeota bacterium]
MKEKKSVRKRKKTSENIKDDISKMGSGDLVVTLKEMGEPGKTENIDLIKKFLESPDEKIHHATLESLGLIGGDKATEAIEEYRGRILGDFDRVCHMDLILRNINKETIPPQHRKKHKPADEAGTDGRRELHLREIDRRRMHILKDMLVDPLLIEIGKELINIADPGRGGGLLERIASIRKEIAMELGLLIPGVNVIENRKLAPTVYEIKIKGVKIARGETIPGYFFAIGSDDKLKELVGKQVIDPTFGLPGIWISRKMCEKAEQIGCMIFDELSVITVQLKEVIRSYAPDLLGRQDVQMLIDNLEESYPAVVKDLENYNISPGSIQKILKNLLRERVSIRDLVTIMETIADNIELTRDVEILTECVRYALSRAICSKFISEEGQIKVISFDPQVERCIIDSIVKTETGSILTLEPEKGQVILEELGVKVMEMMKNNLEPVLLVAPQIRTAIRNITQHAFPVLSVLSWNEIPPGTNLVNFGIISEIGEQVSNL